MFCLISVSMADNFVTGSQAKCFRTICGHYISSRRIVWYILHSLTVLGGIFKILKRSQQIRAVQERYNLPSFGTTNAIRMLIEQQQLHLRCFCFVQNNIARTDNVESDEEYYNSFVPPLNGRLPSHEDSD